MGYFIDGDNTDLLLRKFNDRDTIAFGEIYHRFYNDLHHLTSGLYKNSSVAPNDILQDVFIKLWESKTPQFESLSSIKGYLYVTIKNKFRNYLDHQKSIEKYKDNLKHDRDNFISQIAETETLSILNQAIDLLPSECAKVFRLFIEGWDVSDIAAKLNKSESTVYAQKQKSIAILKEKLSHRTFTMIVQIIKII